MEEDSEEAERLKQTQGIVIDEFTMLDRRAYNKIKKLCSRFPLHPDLRKPNACAEFGYRYVIFCGDLFQLPPASGHPPLVTHVDFQTKFEIMVLKENRRQEKNPSSKDGFVVFVWYLFILLGFFIWNKKT